MGKGSKRRPCLISREEEEIRYALAREEITIVEFKKRERKLQREGKIWRR